MRYVETDDGYAVVVGADETVRTNEQVACWYREIRLDAGTYPLEGKASGFGPVAEGSKPYWLIASIPGTCVEEHFPSLFGGNPTGGGPIHDRSKHYRTTYGIQTQPYAVRFAIEREVNA